MKAFESAALNSKSESFRKLNPHLFASEKFNAEIKKPEMRVRQSAKPLMNKLETEYFDVLKASYPTATIRPQSKKYRVCNGSVYCPDFTAIINGIETAWETKGKHSWDDAMLKIKVAASVWPEVDWWLVWKDASGRWTTQKIIP